MFYLLDFYPRPPRGGRLLTGKGGEGKSRFLPTPSARRATAKWAGVIGFVDISTHALREEGDPRMTR